MNKPTIDMERLINIVICLAGIVLILCGVLLKSGQAETITISVGASLVASSAVAFLSSVYIRRYRHAKEISEQWGLQSITDKRATMNIEINEHMQKVSQNLDYIAFGMTSLRQGAESTVLDCLHRGAELRLLTVDPESPFLSVRDREEKKMEGSTATSIRQLVDWAKRLEEKYPGKVKLRYNPAIPTEYYCRADRMIYTGPYQYGKESQQTITFAYKGPGLAFDYYTKYYDELWREAREP